MVGEEADIDSLKPTEKRYSVVKIDTMKPPGHESAAVKMYEVDDLEEAATPESMGTMWMAYDQDGNSKSVE